MNIRSILIALPSVYLVVALLLMGGQRSPRLPQLSTVPQRVLLFTQGGPPAPGGALAAAPVAAAAPAIRGGGGGAAAQALTPAEAMSKASPAPPKPAGTPYKVKYYDGNSVTIFPHADLGQGGSDWWPSVESGWEKDSLQTIRTLLTKTPGATYIDFGSWIGPTVLFAAPYANKVYGMEPDYRAFQELYWNVKSNDHLADKITVLPLCIADKAGSLTMRGQPGSSMSTLMEETDKQKKIKGRDEWTVECMTLDTFIERNRIDANKLVLKIDTEGAERDILRQLRPFIAKYKPSMLLSMHVFAYPDDEKAHSELQEIILSYKTVLFPNGKIVDRKAFSVGGWCRLCALLLTDMELQESDVQ